MTLGLCGLGRFVVDAPKVGVTLRRYGRAALPFLLIGLGLHVLEGALPLIG
jgi:cadmium resistance protein CadD (predicted permease)